MLGPGVSYEYYRLKQRERQARPKRKPENDPKYLWAMWALFTLFGVLFHVLSGMHWVHEFGHAIFITLEGGTVTRVFSDHVAARGYGTFGLFMGAGTAMAVFAALVAWLVRSRRSVWLAAFFYGRLVAEWFGVYIGSDLEMMSAGGQMVTVVVNSGVVAGAIIGLTVWVAKSMGRWHRERPEHIANPSILHAGKISRL